MGNRPASWLAAAAMLLTAVSPLGSAADGHRLVRYGPAGAEKPGLLDAAGRIRDLSDHFSDLGPETLPDSMLKATNCPTVRSPSSTAFAPTYNVKAIVILLTAWVAWPAILPRLAARKDDRT